MSARSFPGPTVPDSSSAYDLVIVGAGPAGLSAALIAEDQGLRVAIVDEQHDIGGQIMRQPPSGFGVPAAASPVSLPDGLAALRRLRQSSRVDRILGTTAWGIFRDDANGVLQVGINTPEHSRLLRARRVLVATGAYDLPVAFPGWTMPGVMTAGAVQTLIKSQFLRPGRRFVLAGSHPLLLLVAVLLLDNGASIAEVAIARPMPSLGELLKSWRAIPGHVPLFADLLASLLKLRRHGVPLRLGTIIRGADGDDQVQRVTLAGVDSQWQLKPGTERTIEADTLVLGYGLLASSELARQAGCASTWRPERGGWIIAHDEVMRTSVPEISVAGEPAGVKGAELAFLEGKLAAQQIALELGAPAKREQLARAMEETRRAIGKASVFAEAVLGFFAPRLDQLARLATDKTLVCRCEEVEAGTVRAFLDDNPHVSNVNSVKLACRTGMGLCQGRYCQHTVAHLTAEARQCDVGALGAFAARAPIKPIPVRALANVADFSER